MLNKGLSTITSNYVETQDEGKVIKLFYMRNYPAGKMFACHS